MVIAGRPKPLRLFINRPGDGGRYPCFVRLHGGGMCICTAEDFHSLHRKIAAAGLVVVAPDFRNAPEAEYPAGLEDCYAGLKWAAEHLDELGATQQLFVGGDSGGGNLSIATAVLAKQRGLTALKGLYTSCPLLDDQCESPSWHQFSGIVLTRDRSRAFCKIYYNGHDEAHLPMAFPHRMTVDHLKGLVPTLVHLYEFDPLLDEGKFWTERSFIFHVADLQAALSTASC